MGQHSTFSEHGHVAYQIKWIHDMHNMVANILPADSPNPRGQNVKFQHVQNNFKLTIKGMYWYCKCYVALPHGAVGWSAVCDCDIS